MNRGEPEPSASNQLEPPSHRHWKNQAKDSAKHLQIEAEDRRAYKEETVTSQRLLRKHNNAFTGR